MLIEVKWSEDLSHVTRLTVKRVLPFRFGRFTSVPGTQEFYRRLQTILGDKLLIKLTFIDSENKNLHTPKSADQPDPMPRAPIYIYLLYTKLIDLLVFRNTGCGSPIRYFVPDTERQTQHFSRWRKRSSEFAKRNKLTHFIILFKCEWIFTFLPDPLWAPVSHGINIEVNRQKDETIILICQSFYEIYAWIRGLVNIYFFRIAGRPNSDQNKCHCALSRLLMARRVRSWHVS